jgi:DNA-binding transcriptional regulator/RsmH inhibitor MraZ
MAAAVLIIEEVIGLSRKTLLNGVSHIFQIWKREIYYKFSHVRFTYLFANPGAVLQNL